jgi:hypothetical protein
VIRESGLATIDPDGLDEPLPTPVSQKAKKAQATSAPQMTVNLGCRLLVLLKE